MTPDSHQTPAFQRFRTVLHPRSPKAAPSPCYTDMVTAVAIRVRVPLAALGTSATARCTNTTGLQRLLEKHFGTQLVIKIRCGARTVWQGPVRLAGLEMPRAGGDHIPLTLAFAAPLETAELEGLGLIDPPRPPPAPRSEPTAVEATPSPSLPVSEPRTAGRAQATPDGNRRRTERLDTELPLAIHTTKGPVEAEIRDVSRTGLRFHIRACALGLSPTRDLYVMAEGVGRVLQQSFEADLNHAMLGSLIQKSVQMVRISVARESEELIEICGRFEIPLQLEEATMLGLPLPPSVDSDEDWDPERRMVAPAAREVVLPERPRAPRPAPTKRPARSVEAGADPQAPVELERPDADGALGFTTTRRFRAYLRSRAPDGPQPLSCQTDLVGYEGVRLRIPRPPEAARGVAAAAAALREAYGAEPNLKLMDKADHLWTGATRIVAIDLPGNQPGDMLVTLLFVHALRPAEVRRLKLPAAIT